MKYKGIREEELKNKTAYDYFGIQCTKIIGDGLCVSMHQNHKELFEQNLCFGLSQKDCQTSTNQ